MVNLLSIAQLLLAVLLVALVLLQKTNTDASGAFSSDGGTGGVLQKRGAEKVLHQATIVVAVLFVLSVLSHLFIK